MPRDDDFTPEEKLEADLLAEDFTGKPVNYGSTAKAISELTKRIAHLKQRLKLLQEQAESAENSDSALSASSCLIQEIRQAEADLAAYRKQQEGRN